LRRGDDTHHRAIFSQQHVAAPHHGAAWQKKKTPSERPSESVASKRLFAVSQSSSRVDARLTSTGVGPAPRDEFVDVEHEGDRK
jgi:hypothetical protein